MSGSKSTSAAWSPVARRGHLIPGLGELRVRELTVAACDRWLRAVEASHGAATTRMCRSVLSGV